MTKKKEKTTLEILMEKCVCSVCGKKKCTKKHEWEHRLSHLQCEGYDLEELDYKVRKLFDTYLEVRENVDKLTNENQLYQESWKKQKPKPVKKTG